MQILPAILMDFSTISRAPSLVFSISAVAARFGEGAAGADGGDALVGLDHIAVAADDVRVGRIGHQQQRFQVAQNAVRAPFLGQFHDAARQVAVELLQLGFEAREQREGVGRGAGETGQDLVVVEPAQLSGGRLSGLPAQGDLAVAGHHDFAVAAHTQDCCRTDSPPGTRRHGWDCASMRLVPV